MKTSFPLDRQYEHFHHGLTSPKDLDPLIEKIGNAKYVLLGEATHGTHEFYTWRSEISRRLIEEKGFSFIAVEGDWPDCYKINRYIKGQSNGSHTLADLLRTFNRWPTWMWANWEVVALGEWLAKHNKNLHASEKVGFYGLDVYSLWESMNSIIEYLNDKDPQGASIAKRAYECFEPYYEEGSNYAKAIGRYHISCKEEVLQLLMDIRSKMDHYQTDHEASFNLEQNALIAVNAEKYYRSMLSFGPDSWNIRDKHMADTLDRLMKFHGPEAKAIAWEHNTHIGDARATDMHDDGMWNIGQLIREEHEQEGVMLVGFATYQGTVIAGSEWGAPMEVMQVPPARQGSIEHYLHSEFEEDHLFLFDKNIQDKIFKQTVPHRAIGVVYHPSRERIGNYVPSNLSKRYDAFIYVDTTMALHPLQLKPDGHKVPETFPFGI
jgi:erythromycin esterase-like protein